MTSPFEAIGIAKGQKWECKKCGHTNKVGELSCAKCGHEPVLGRSDFEGNKWRASHPNQDDET